ncbi:hypothetical protein PROP_02258 [Propionicimonas sp. T2.31MG-18]
MPSRPGHCRVDVGGACLDCLESCLNQAIPLVVELRSLGRGPLGGPNARVERVDRHRGADQVSGSIRRRVLLAPLRNLRLVSHDSLLRCRTPARPRLHSDSRLPIRLWKKAMLRPYSLTRTRSLTPCQRAVSAADSTRTAVNRSTFPGHAEGPTAASSRNPRRRLGRCQPRFSARHRVGLVRLRRRSRVRRGCWRAHRTAAGLGNQCLHRGRDPAPGTRIHLVPGDARPCRPPDRRRCRDPRAATVTSLAVAVGVAAGLALTTDVFQIRVRLPLRRE